MNIPQLLLTPKARAKQFGGLACWRQPPSTVRSGLCGSDANALASKALAAKEDGVVVWGSPSDAAYVHIVEKVKLAQRLLSATLFTEPYKGEVGTVFLFRRPN